MNYVRGADPVWLFDLDNTLHNADPHIFPRLNRAMTRYVAELVGIDEASACALRDDYWHRYGATLLGLMRHHGANAEDFLRVTHDFPDLANMVVGFPPLATRLKHLPGRKVVFSNAPRAYVDAILKLIGLSRSFDAVFAIEDLGLHPKPQNRAYLHVLRSLGVPATRCIMVEDTSANLLTAKRMGMKTVLISRRPTHAAHVDLRLSSILDIARAL